MADGDLTITVSVPTTDEIAQALALELENVPTVSFRVFQPPLAADGTLTLVHGDSYLAADGRALVITGDWPDLTGWALTFTARPYGDGQVVSVPVTMPTATTVQVELTAAETLSFAEGGRYRYDVQATLGESVQTLVRGRLEVLADAT